MAEKQKRRRIQDLTEEERAKRAERFVAQPGSVSVLGRYDPKTNTIIPFTQAELDARDRMSRALEAQDKARAEAGLPPVGLDD